MNYQIITASGGKHSGLQAIGVAGKQKVRQRAGRLAITIAAKVNEAGPDGTIVSPGFQDAASDTDFITLATQALEVAWYGKVINI